jgi:hypothetical protein
MIIVADPRIEVREGTTLFEAGGLGAVLRPLVGPGESPARGRSPSEAPEFYVSKHVSQKVIFNYHISVIINGGIDRMTH